VRQFYYKVREKGRGGGISRKGKKGGGGNEGKRRYVKSRMHPKPLINVWW